LKDLEYRNDQLVHLRDKITEICGKQPSNEELGQVFNISRSTVFTIIRNFRPGLNLSGRPRSLTEQEESQLVALVEENWRSKSAITPTSLLLTANTLFRANMSYGWLHSFMNRKKQQIKNVKAEFQDVDRVDIPRVFFENYFVQASRFLKGKIAELVFNIDEVGASDWEDRHAIMSVVPATVLDKTVTYKASRKFQHATLVACISAAGDSVPPLIVAREGDDKKIWDLGWREDKDFTLRHAQKCYVTKDLFLEYLCRIVVPFINFTRTAIHRENEIAVIMMDNCSCHVNTEILGFLSSNRILAFTFPPHSTNFLQPLDLVLFGLFKRMKLIQEPELARWSHEGQIVLLQESYEKVATRRNIRASFRKAGVTLNCTRRPYTVDFDENSVRNNFGFSQVWDADFDIARLTERRRNKAYGALNGDDVVGVMAGGN
jgi:hypothetical protein